MNKRITCLLKPGAGKHFPAQEGNRNSNIPIIVNGLDHVVAQPDAMRIKAFTEHLPRFCKTQNTCSVRLLNVQNHNVGNDGLLVIPVFHQISNVFTCSFRQNRSGRTFRCFGEFCDFITAVEHHQLIKRNACAIRDPACFFQHFRHCFFNYRHIGHGILFDFIPAFVRGFRKILPIYQHACMNLGFCLHAVLLPAFIRRIGFYMNKLKWYQLTTP